MVTSQFLLPFFLLFLLSFHLSFLPSFSLSCPSPENTCSTDSPSRVYRSGLSFLPILECQEGTGRSSQQTLTILLPVKVLIAETAPLYLCRSRERNGFRGIYPRCLRPTKFVIPPFSIKPESRTILRGGATISNEICIFSPEALWNFHLTGLISLLDSRLVI